MNLDFAKVCGKHSAIYEAYYKQIDPKGSGAIEAMTAAKFLKKSGLSDVVLSRVWDLSDPNGKGFLDKPGFFVGLKLVSLAQAGQVVNMSNIYMETANPPKVGDLPKIIPPRIQTVPVSSGGVVNSDWSVSVIDRLKYEQLFESQKPVAGKLPGNKVKGLLMDSKLPMETLGKIWDLADQDKDGNLDKHEFIVAMHLVYQTLEKRTVPDVLPPELRKPGSGAPPPPKPAPPAGGVASMPRAPSGEGFGDGGFVASFPMDIAPPPVVPPLPPAVVPSIARMPAVGGGIMSQSLISTDPLVPIGAPPSVTANVEWVVTPSEQKRYEVMFRDSDRDKDGLVSGLEVKNVFLQSGVAQNCLAHIWALCDTNQSGKLTLEQFALAMWMVERKQKGIEPPQVLTANMVPPSMRSIISGVDLQPQEPKPIYTNPELEMISKEIEELAKERRALETEIAQKEADIRIKSGEVRSLQGELDTLSATLKQLEHQRGEAQKRLDDLKTQSSLYEEMLRNMNASVDAMKIQVSKIREQCQKQEDTINEQEGELNAKRSELQKLKDEEIALQKEYDDNSRELSKLTQHLQNTQLQISSIRSMVTQLMETQRQMTDALLLCRAAIENSDGELVSEYQLKIEPDFDDARKTLEKKIEEPKNDPFEEANSNKKTALSNGFGNDPFSGTTIMESKSAFDDSFTTGFPSSGFDGFGNNSGFSSTQNQDPFGSTAFGNKPNAVTPDSSKDDFDSDPFAALHAPTGQGQVLNPNSQKSGPPPRPESPSPALPPKKSKVPPPRPAPPRPVQGPARTTSQSTTDAFGQASSGGFADFADFDNKLAHNPPPLPPPLLLSASSTTSSASTTPSNKMLAQLAPNNNCPGSVSTSIVGSSLFSDFNATTTSTAITTSSVPSLSTQTIETTMQSLSMLTSINSNVDNTTTTTTSTNTILTMPIVTTTTPTPQMEIKRTLTPQQKATKTTARKTKLMGGPTDFSDDPFKDYRYEDPFNLKDPFADDNDVDADVFADSNKVFKDDISSDEDEKTIQTKTTSPTTINNSSVPLPAKRHTPVGSDFLEQFDTFNLNCSPVPSKRSQSVNSAVAVAKSNNNTPVPNFDSFADFDAFIITASTNVTKTINNNNNDNNSSTFGKDNINTLNDSFFDAFNDTFNINNSKENTNKNLNNIYDAFGTIKNNNNDNSDIKSQTFDAFTAFKTTNITTTITAPAEKNLTTTTTADKNKTTSSEKLFEDDFNDNGFDDDFFNMNNNNKNNIKTKNNNFGNFDEFDGGPSFVADFKTALNNSINLNTSVSTDDGAAATKTSTLTKVYNNTTVTKLDNASAAKLPDKFASDYSQADTFDADLEEAIKRSMVDQ